LKKWILYFRKIPLAGINIANVLVYYYTEVANIMLILACAPLLFVTLVKPLPQSIAQLIVVLLHCTGSLSFALGAAISCIQIFYVTKFEFIFSFDPYKVAQNIFVTLTVTVALPHCVLGIYTSFYGLLVDKRVLLLTKGDYHGNDVSLHSPYSNFWLLLFILTSSFAFIFIPLFLRAKKSGLNNHLPQQNTLSFRKYLLTLLLFLTLVSIILYFAKPTNSNQLQLPGYVFLISNTMMLAYRLSESEARTAGITYCFKLLNIRDRSDVINQDIEMSEQVSQPTITGAARNSTAPKNF
jgi:hypothetical protein